MYRYHSVITHNITNTVKTWFKSLAPNMNHLNKVYEVNTHKQKRRIEINKWLKLLRKYLLDVV